MTAVPRRRPWSSRRRPAALPTYAQTRPLEVGVDEIGDVAAVVVALAPVERRELLVGDLEGVAVDVVAGLRA